jgi:hypothetical protein
MKKSILITITSSFILFLSACKKNNDGTNVISENINDLTEAFAVTNATVSGRVSVIVENNQTKYGMFSGTGSVQALLNADLGISSFSVGKVNIEKKSTDFYMTTILENEALARNFTTSLNSSMKIASNGVDVSNTPIIPYANAVTLSNGLENWTVSKTKGLILNWKIKDITTQQVNSADNSKVFNTLQLGSAEFVKQVAGSKTVVAIIPGDLRTTAAKSAYWVVKDGAKSFTIPSTSLSAYKTGEEVKVIVATGTNLTYKQNEKTVDVLCINMTHLSTLNVIK